MVSTTCGWGGEERGVGVGVVFQTNTVSFYSVLINRKEKGKQRYVRVDRQSKIEVEELAGLFFFCIFFYPEVLTLGLILIIDAH